MKLASALAFLAAAVPGIAWSHVIERVVALGQSAEVDRGVRIEALRVIEDSRCPAGTNCVWAGRVVIAARVRDHGHRSTVRLTLGQPLVVGHGRLTLDQVLPEKGAKPIPARDYRFGFSYARALPQPGEAAPL